jgi:hypothetical protein
LDLKILQKLCIKDKKHFQKKEIHNKHYYKMVHLIKYIIKNHQKTKKSQNHSHTNKDLYKTDPYNKNTQHPIKLIIALKKATNPTKRKAIPPYAFFNKKTLLKCSDIESNPGPGFNFLTNHPQIHHDKQKTYFFNKTTQIKPEYHHIFELFKPCLNHPISINTNQQLIQFCTNNNQCPQSYLFYAILITLAPTPEQNNQLIAENSTQWTINLIKNLTECPHQIPTDLHKLQKFHLENSNITTPLSSIQKELYSFITTERPNPITLYQKFPYLPDKMLNEALKCLQPIPNFTHPNPTHKLPTHKPPKHPTH